MPNCVFSHLPIDRIFGITVYGENGVYLFFVISGFIISTTFLKYPLRSTKPTLELWAKGLRTNKSYIIKFWKKRFLRLFPTILLLFNITGIAVIGPAGTIVQKPTVMRMM